IIESSPSLLIAFDKDYRVYLWNYASEQYTHIPAKQAIGKNLYDLFPEVLPFSTFISEVFEQNREIVIRHQSIKSDNSFFNLYVYPLNDKTDRHAVLRLDDISELEKREAELRQSQKMELVGNLAGGLAHDFNNILGIIIGNLSLINAKIKFSNHIEIEEIKEFISKLQKAGERASSLVKQLLSLARKKEIKYVQFSVNEMLGRVIDLARNTLDKSIHFQMEILDSNIQIFADEGQIEQVILNLIVNASHALTIMQDSSFTKNGFIKISSQIILSDYTFKKRHIEAEKNSYLCISVEDNGIGMDSNTVSKIFEPFFTTKSVGVGTGLGLAMVYNIIKNHNGFIDVYSEPGIGTKMSVYLPIVEGLKTDNSQHTSGIIKGNGLVLIIDDDTKMRDIACKMLKFMNFNVIQAENGQIGLDLYQQYQTEILFILLDVVMPVKSGDQTMQALVRINPKVKVIVSSGFKKDSRVTQILNNGAIAFIQKPYTIEELSETIRINLLNQNQDIL
ncbi:MAG: response regulator, partial [Candidatus Cloacimonetes bacterium]|nr:response regulator [Candidatus Cloacimonadota bacterium]